MNARRLVLGLTRKDPSAKTASSSFVARFAQPTAMAPPPSQPKNSLGVSRRDLAIGFIEISAATSQAEPTTLAVLRNTRTLGCEGTIRLGGRIWRSRFRASGPSDVDELLGRRI